MALLEKLQNIEKKYALTFFGFLLAMIFGGLAIYSTFFQKRNPAIKYEVESSASVFDVKEDVGKLEVNFEGVNLRETQQTLTLMTLKVSNSGSEPILKNDYDDKDPLGFEITTGQLIKVELLRANKPYLTKNLNIIMTTQTNATSAVFTPVILDPGDAFWVKILVLHRERTNPELKPIGTVAGAGEINLVGLSVKEATPSILAQVFGGPLWVQLARLLGYFLGAFGILIVTSVTIILPLVALSDVFSKRKRKARVARFRANAAMKILPEFEWVIESYVENGNDAMWAIFQLLLSPDMAYVYAKRKFESLNREIPFSFRNQTNAANLIDKGLIVRIDNKAVVEKSFQNFIDEFSRFIGYNHAAMVEAKKEQAKINDERLLRL